MPVTESRTLPAPFIEALGKTYGDILPGVAGAPPTTTAVAQQPGETADQFAARQTAAQQTGIRAAGMAGLAPQVAALDPLQTQAIGKAGGLGDYAPYLAGAGAQATTAGQTLAGVSPYIGAAGTGLGAAGTTLGGVSPYIGAAGTGLAAAGTTLGTAGTELTAAGAAGGYGGVPGYLTAAGGYTGPSAYQQFMSPYQQQVMTTALDEYDVQAGKSALALGAPGVAGAFGGGRHGIAEAEYQSTSDRNRAALQAGLLQQGYGQAQQLAGQAYGQQMGLAGAQQQYGAGLAGLAAQRAGLAGQQAGFAQGQLGLGQAVSGLSAQEAALAQQQLGLGAAQTGLAGAQMGQAGFQTQLAGLAPQLAAQEISGLGTLGSVRQAQSQAVLDAQREAATMAAYEPMQRAGFFGSQLTGLMGGYPAQHTFTQQPSPSPLATALQAGTGLASIWGNLALAKSLAG